MPNTSAVVLSLGTSYLLDVGKDAKNIFINGNLNTLTTICKIISLIITRTGKTSFVTPLWKNDVVFSKFPEKSETHVNKTIHLIWVS